MFNPRISSRSLIFSIIVRYILKSYQDVHLNDEPMALYTIYKTRKYKTNAAVIEKTYNHITIFEHIYFKLMQVSLLNVFKILLTTDNKDDLLNILQLNDKKPIYLLISKEK